MNPRRMTTRCNGRLNLSLKLLPRFGRQVAAPLAVDVMRNHGDVATRGLGMSNKGGTQHSITEFWNAVASHYDSHPGNTVAPSSEGYSDWVDLFRQSLHEQPCRVLDVCTGTGFTALICAALGHEVVGIDLAQQMLDVARRTAVERGLQASFLDGDAVAPDFEPGTFDVVTCRHSLWTLRSADTAFANWRKLLRPGGRVIAVDSIHVWDESDPDSPQDQLFRRHYTGEVQAEIPFMHLHGKAPLVEAFVQSGYSGVTFRFLDGKFSDGDEHVPYLLVASR
jgi:ubiquinone/menaquinone biosynthesis C-methylase UbiE